MNDQPDYSAMAACMCFVEIWDGIVSFYRDKIIEFEIQQQRRNEGKGVTPGMQLVWDTPGIHLGCRWDAVGLVAAGLSIAGLVLIPFSRDISLVLTMAGIGTGLTCGAMSAGSNIYKNREQRSQKPFDSNFCEQEKRHLEFMEQKKYELQMEKMRHVQRMRELTMASNLLESYSLSVSTAEIYTNDGDIYRGLPAIQYASGNDKTSAIIRNAIQCSSDIQTIE